MACGCGKRTADAQTSAQVQAPETEQHRAQRESQQATTASAEKK